jgi:hypothetical protein
VLGELPEDEAARFEEHYFGCETCFRRAMALEHARKRLTTSLPPLLTQERHEALQNQRALEVVHVEAGGNGLIKLGSDNAFGIWILHAPLEGVARVDVEVRPIEGDFTFGFNDVPFDRERGQVLLACQLHYRAVPGGPRLNVRLLETADAGGRELGQYILDHQFESA